MGETVTPYIDFYSWCVPGMCLLSSSTRDRGHLVLIESNGSLTQHPSLQIQASRTNGTAPGSDLRSLGTEYSVLR